MSKMTLIIIMILSCISFTLADDDDDINDISFKDLFTKHYCFLIGAAISIPGAVWGLTEISKEYISGPTDSLLDNKRDYTVSDHNGEVLKKTGAFLLVDFLVPMVIGWTIDSYRNEKHEKQREFVTVIANPFTGVYGVKAVMRF